MLYQDILYKFSYKNNKKNHNKMLSSKTKDNYLYGNNYTLIVNPWILVSSRIFFFIKNYPIISIGKNILIPLLLFLFVNIIYIYLLFLTFFGTLLKKCLTL